MEVLEDILSRYSRVELMEYEIVPSEYVRVLLLGYPFGEDASGFVRLNLFFKQPLSISFGEVTCPSGALISALANKTSSGLFFVSLCFESQMMIEIAFKEFSVF